MDVRNTEHFLPNRVSTEKRQYRNECSNKTREQDNIKRKKDIFKQTVSEKNKRIKISFPTKYHLGN